MIWEDPYLYILVRNDLTSLNAGKAVAQGAHAANQMVKEFAHSLCNHVPGYAALFEEWQSQANGFGTTITLSVNEQEMRTAVRVAQALDFHAGIMTDPTYPFEAPAELAKVLMQVGSDRGIIQARAASAANPNALLLRPEDVCAYVFGPKVELSPILGRFPLMA